MGETIMKKYCQILCFALLVLLASVVRADTFINPVLINPSITGGRLVGVGAINATSVGATTPGTGTFTAINASSVGATTPGTGAFTVVNATGTSTLNLVGGVANFIRSQGRAVNTTAALAAVTLAQNIASTYLATPAAAITVTLAAPFQDGERRRVCFGAATTVTWAVTAPATATAGLPAANAAGACVEVSYVVTAGSPANAAATTWYRY